MSNLAPQLFLVEASRHKKWQWRLYQSAHGAGWVDRCIGSVFAIRPIQEVLMFIGETTTSGRNVSTKIAAHHEQRS